MQQPPHSPTSSQSSRPSSKTARREEQTAPLEYAIRFGSTDDDALETFRFLMEVAGPVLFGPPDPTKAMGEILRVIHEGAPIMAYLGDTLVGALGLTRAEWWYNFDNFLTDRWFFTLPILKYHGCGAALLAEAQLLATSSDLPVVINGHLRRRGNGVFFTSPRVYLPQKDAH